MITAEQVQRSFPDVERIRDARLREFVPEFWEHVGRRNPYWTDIEAVPMHPTIPIERYGNLGAHVRGMAKIARVLVPTYAEEWKIPLDLDAFLLAVHIHDAAKVIEFVEKDGALVATPGFNHAIEAGKIALQLGIPRPIAHMVAAHSYIGPLVMPRTKEAQLFQFLDPMCLPVFPELGESSVVRHLRANGWEPPPPPVADVP